MKHLLVLLTLLFAATLFAEDVTITSKGSGPTYRYAVNDALVLALQQQFGMQLTATDVAHLSESESVVNANGDETSKVEINDSIKKKMETFAKGRIIGFQVIQENYDALTKRYTVEVNVVMPGQYIVGLDPNNRRRMAVSTFLTKQAGVTIYGAPVKTDDWFERFANNLNVHLTQTRKFTMLDRNFDNAVKTELNRLNDTNAAPADIIRVGQQLGTDYLLVGSLSFSNVANPPVNPFTGQAIKVSSLFLELTYRVILAPTGQLKWADTVKLDAASFPASTVPEFISMTAEAAATSVSDGILAAILPFEVVKVTAAGQIIIGEGGKSIQPGELLSVFSLGEEVKDTRTGEVLDYVEERVAIVQVERVTEKISYAKIVDGDISKIAVGSRLRREQYEQPAQNAPQQTPTQVQPTQNGGVVVPF